MSSLSDACERIGDVVVITTADGWTVSVRILDVRQAYGRLDYLVRPMDGGKPRYVSAERISP